MRLATTADIAAVNAWVERDCGEPVDFTEYFANRMNACLIEGEGGAMFAWRGPGIFEGHAFFEQRGREVLDLAHRVLAWMREHRGARIFWTAIPVENRKAIMFIRLLGWKSQGTAELPHGPCEVFLGE